MLISFSREDGQCTSQNLRGTTCAQQKQRGERGERELEESVSFALHREILLFFAEDSLNSIAPGPQEEPKSAPKCQIRVVYIFSELAGRGTRDCHHAGPLKITSDKETRIVQLSSR